MMRGILLLRATLTKLVLLTASSLSKIRSLCCAVNWATACPVVSSLILQDLLENLHTDIDLPCGETLMTLQVPQPREQQSDAL
jgi:hypothetical protein